jgi:arginyl-tRNA synthetase
MKNMSVSAIVKEQALKAAQTLFDEGVSADAIVVNQTVKEFEGDYTIVVFPLIKISKQNPEKTAQLLGEYLKEKTELFASFNVVKGFLNLSFTDSFWLNRLNDLQFSEDIFSPTAKSEKVLLEYCGPNTNKPLHIGHLRNMMLGYSMGEILKVNGYPLHKVNIYNDRGIAICKSMAAYITAGNGATPESAGIKGDHFVGDYYVRFGGLVESELKEVYRVPDGENIFKSIGKEREVAEQETKVFGLAKELLLKWEAGDEETIALWSKMNGWVYDGFKKTFDLLGVDFEKDYYESETYKLGKEIVEEGLEKGLFYKRADGATAIDFSPQGLDEKVLLRSDGTSIYITQDLGTANERYKEFAMDRMIYVVANEQDYHFKVLKLILQQMGKKWADGIYHLSYALVESPTGRFKSREGKTADADDMIAEVLRIAEEKTKELGKIDDFTEDEAKALYKLIGLGALKFFILRVNPYKKIIFNPEESIDFQGQTGPFIQYTHARIRSIIRKAEREIQPIETSSSLHETERQLILLLNEYPEILQSACDKYDPSEIANFAYALAKTYNKFYNDLPILSNTVSATDRNTRVCISAQTARTIKHAMKLLGIDVPEKM